MQKAAERAKANPDAVRAAKRKWNHANAHLWRTYYATYAKRCRAAMPSWVTAVQRAEMWAIYKEAASRPDGPWEVDHIVPLKGKNVCGLHVPWNLRIVSAPENRSKGAKVIEDLAVNHG